MNCCQNGNNCLWILIIALILGNGGSILNSRALSGCGLPILTALAYCMYKNGTLGEIFSRNGGCGCNG